MCKNENLCQEGIECYLLVCCVYLSAMMLWRKTTKMSWRILPKCWCVSIVVKLRKEFKDAIAVDAGWFWMLWRHSNTTHVKNIRCVCGELWCTWYWCVTEKKWNLGEWTRCEEGVYRGWDRWGWLIYNRVWGGTRGECYLVVCFFLFVCLFVFFTWAFVLCSLMSSVPFLSD